jgi:hypothetical protein
MAFSTKTEVSDKSFKNTCNMKGQFETMHDIQITEEQVTKLLKNLNPHKAPGPDNIAPRVLKELATHIQSISSTNNHIQGILQHRRNTQ